MRWASQSHHSSAFFDRTETGEMVEAVSATAIGIASRADVAAKFLQSPRCRWNGDWRMDGTGRLLDSPLPRHFDWWRHMDRRFGWTVAVRQATTAGQAAATTRARTRDPDRSWPWRWDGRVGSNFDSRRRRLAETGAALRVASRHLLRTAQ